MSLLCKGFPGVLVIPGSVYLTILGVLVRFSCLWMYLIFTFDVSNPFWVYSFFRFGISLGSRRRVSRFSSHSSSSSSLSPRSPRSGTPTPFMWRSWRRQRPTTATAYCLTTWQVSVFPDHSLPQENPGSATVWLTQLIVPHLSPISFIFMQFSANIRPKIRLVPPDWCPPPRKSWICYCL